jgi:hypothetical protein
VNDDRHPDEIARRQAPLYGEYATPEEVAEIRGPDAEPLVPVVLAPPSGRPLPGPPPPGAASHTAAPNGWDAPITLALLAFGVFDVIRSAIGYLDFRGTLVEFARVLGVDSARFPASVQVWGDVLIAIDVVLLVTAAAVSFRLIRRGRRAFWVPLAAGALAAMIGGILLLAVLSASGVPLVQNQG